MSADENLIENIYETLYRQLNNFWKTEVDQESFMKCIKIAVEKTKVSFGDSNRKYYLAQGFSVLNTAVYSVFLYYLAHGIGFSSIIQGGVYHWRTNYTI